MSYDLTATYPERLLKLTLESINCNATVCAGWKCRHITGDLLTNHLLSVLLITLNSGIPSCTVWVPILVDMLLPNSRRPDVLMFFSSAYVSVKPCQSMANALSEL